MLLAPIARAANPTFGTATTVSTGSGTTPYSIISGDFNGDGKIDFATANYGTSTISVLTGNGAGVFTLATSPSTGSGTSPYSIISGDFNGDGMIDFATANSGNGTISVLTGNGLGTFTLATNVSTGSGTSPLSIISGDFNGDGKIDFATANSGNGTISVLTGNGLGTFTLATNVSTGAGTQPASIISGDFNGDGMIDFATANYGTSTISVLTGNGLGTFTLATSPSTGTGTAPRSIISGDFNGDGKTDFASANSQDSTISVLTGNGLGTFALATNVSTGTSTTPYSIISGDFNGDGKIDFATANTSTRTVSVLTGNGLGTFALATSPSTGASTGPRSIISGDFNGDGKTDFATANYGNSTVGVLLNTTVPTISIGNAPSVAEGNTTGASSLVFPITLSAATTSDVTVNYAVTGGTAQSSDYGTATGTATIPANSTTGSITIPIIGDQGLEPDETVIVTISSPTNATLGTPTTGTGTIQNDDTGLVVTTTADIINGSDNDNTLREAITTANGLTNGGTISFSSLFNSAQTITLGSTLPSVAKAITLTGPGARLLTISGNNAVRVMDVAASGNLTLKDVTVSGGSTSGSGGGIQNVGTLTVLRCTLAGNTTSNASVGGGAIYNTGALTIVSSTFSGNTAPSQYGGGVYNTGSTPVTVTNSTFAGNSAQYGGGVFTDRALTLSNCTLTGNSVVNSGGGIYNNQGPNVTAKNSLIVGNTGGDTFGITNGGGNIIGGTTTAAGLDSAGLANNGGPTNTIALTTRGTAVNAGNNALVAADTLDLDGDGDTTETLPYDQRGTGFPRIVGGTVDSGAYESNFLPPALTSFTPTSGTIGTSVVITGTGFTGATSVKFNGTSATTYSVDSATQITATVPTGATTGTISVTAANITATSTGSFTVLSSVSVAVSPASVLESGPPLVYTFTRTGALNAAITVNFSLTGTATYGTDYTQTGADTYNTATNTGTVTFAVNATTATVTLTPVSDTTIEPDETAIVTLAAGSGYSAVAPTSATGTIQNDDFTPVATSGLLIGEFRAHGSSGALDEYIELANSTTGVLSIGGWKVRYLSGGSLVTATIPANTTIPAMGHYLFTGSGYNTTLSGISGSDQTLANPMDDATGITLLNAASTVVDAVSFAGSSMAGEGTLLPSAPTANGEYAFERRQSSGNPAGVPLDNNNNSGDFIFVSTTGGAFASITGAGTTTTLSSTLGAPSPNSTTGYVQTGSVAQTLLDTSVANSVAPNRVRLNAVDSGVTGAPDRFGTLRLRRTLTNNGGTTYTRVRFHVVTITTYSAGGLGGYSDLNQADMRLLTSPDETGIATSTGAKNVIGTSVQAPATLAVGGGLNANTVVLNQALTPGSSANYSFELGVARKGNFLVGFTIELLP